MFPVKVITRRLAALIPRRGLAPQNKPELQKVLEKRKRDQVLKAQKEDQEAHKKRSDLEIELMKRQQKLEQVQLKKRECGGVGGDFRLLLTFFLSDGQVVCPEVYTCMFSVKCFILQLELEQQKIEEEQENTPEFVKMKSNLRRTKQETAGEERTT